MTWILWLIAVACIIYYVVIVLYSGITTSFSLIWLFFAAVCFFFSFGIENYEKHKDKIPLYVPVAAITVACAGIVIFAVVEILIFTGVAVSDASNLDYVIVLGARVKDDGLSKSLQNRLDKAIDYLDENPGTTLILSGGQGADEPVAEAIAMRDYLVFNGVREEQLILEMRSTSTVENIAYSRVEIEKEQERRKEKRSESSVFMEPGTYLVVPDKPIKIGVLTSDFHVFRAMRIAEKWGIPDVYGIACESDPVLFVNYCVRECAAILKDRVVGNM
jgi:uncharacterized SAM-binding protein YcdF (DUF218 family)